MKMIVQLQCGHTILTEQPTVRVHPCPVHKMLYPVHAIECREHKTKCTICKYGRWHGSDEAGAIADAIKHRTKTGHFVMLDYLQHPDKQRMIRQAFGRKVKRYIEGKPVIFEPITEDEIHDDSAPPY